jgi:hypothetical protein
MTCPTGKRPYPTKAAARTALASATRRNPHRQRRESRAYRCHTCNAWHLTSQTA